LPSELVDVDEFIEKSESASECRVKRVGGIVKMKLRTPRRLYTLKVDEKKAEELLKDIKCEIVEI
jgi:hypothetical protein